jgi:hypothetical protein
VVWEVYLEQMALRTTVNQVRERVTFVDVILFKERDEELRATDRHRYNAANHFSTSGTGGRNTTSVVDDGTLIISVDRPSSL